MNNAPESPTAPLSNERTNQVIKVTTQKVLADVRHAFRTMPALQFSGWLQAELEAAERLP